MFGAIIGDILGSIHEKIPNLPLRKELQMTDDSFLTLAAYDWVQKIDYIKFNNCFKCFLVNFEHPEWISFEKEIIKSAEECLMKWHKIGHTLNENITTEIPVFSPGFEAWIATKKTKAHSLIKHKGTTNGCLMRNSSIVYYGVNNNLTLIKILKLSEIFCCLTHPSQEAIQSVRLHSSLLYYVYHHVIKKHNIKKCLTTDDFSLPKISDPLFFTNLNIKPLEFWQNQESKFIWDAKTSLDIALSAVYFSNSFQSTIDFCNNTKMDTDTYCAIAGPIAAGLWKIDTHNINIGLKYIQQCPEAYDLLKNNLIVDFQTH